MNDTTTETDPQQRRTLFLRTAGQIASGICNALTSLATMVATGATALFALYWYTGPGPIPREHVYHLALVAGVPAVIVLVIITVLDEIIRRARYRRFVAAGGINATSATRTTPATDIDRHEDKQQDGEQQSGEQGGGR